MDHEMKQTPMHGRHLALGANMGCFAGYDMPMWYKRGAREEHLAVLATAGLFDTSHMAVIDVTGEKAFDLLQTCFSRDLGKIHPQPQISPATSRCAYGVFLNDRGGVIDDAIVYPMSSSRYLVVVNAGNGFSICSHLQAHSLDAGLAINDLTGLTGKLDIQGPLSGRILAAAGAFDHMAEPIMAYFSFQGDFKENPIGPRIQGKPILLSRTGYTGEFGFEIIAENADILEIWDYLMVVGESYGMLPCGLAARDSLRAGALLPLSHQDIGDWIFLNHPWTMALPFNSSRTGFTKDFVGGKALLENLGTCQSFTYPFAGFDLRKVSVDRMPQVIEGDGRQVGKVLTCVTDMGIGRHQGRIVSVTDPDVTKNFTVKGLSCGFLMADTALNAGDCVTLDDGSRKIEVEIRTDIRPCKTASASMKAMMSFDE